MPTLYPTPHWMLYKVPDTQVGPGAQGTYCVVVAVSVVVVVLVVVVVVVIVEGVVVIVFVIVAVLVTVGVFVIIVVASTLEENRESVHLIWTGRPRFGWASAY